MRTGARRPGRAEDRLASALLLSLADAQTPFSINGRLSVCGTWLCNQYGNPIQLRGMSTHGLQGYPWGDCLKEASVQSLATDWGADILRVAMYIQEGGWTTDKGKEFFERVVPLHGPKGNVLFEIVNEPNGVPWSRIKEYADQIVPVIRKHDTKSPILVGTMGWSSLGVSANGPWTQIASAPI